MKVNIPHPEEIEKSGYTVEIDPWDSWNADVTLAHIIAPLLRQLKETKHGYPASMTDTRWDEILDEMIWAFEYKSNNFDSLMDKNIDETQQRLNAAFKLFGQYYENLWD